MKSAELWDVLCLLITCGDGGRGTRWGGRGGGAPRGLRGPSGEHVTRVRVLAVLSTQHCRGLDTQIITIQASCCQRQETISRPRFVMGTHSPPRPCQETDWWLCRLPQHPAYQPAALHTLTSSPHSCNLSPTLSHTLSHRLQNNPHRLLALLRYLATTGSTNPESEPQR